jgi:putative phosphoesterase
VRVGLIADIHGNRYALDHVLCFLDEAGVDQVLCAGDVANLGPDPAGAIRTLRDRSISTVIGNADLWLIPELTELVEPASAPVTLAMTDWCRNQLTADDCAWLAGLPRDLPVEADHWRVRVCHGSPQSVDRILAADTPGDRLEQWLAPGERVMLINGHTHIALARRHNDGYLINPGSAGLPGVGPGTAGLPVNHAVDWVECAIIAIGDAGHSIALHRLPVDLAAMTAEAERSGMPHFDWWRSRWSQGAAHAAG